VGNTSISFGLEGGGVPLDPGDHPAVVAVMLGVQTLKLRVQFLVAEVRGGIRVPGGVASAELGESADAGEGGTTRLRSSNSPSSRASAVQAATRAPCHRRWSGQ
jgi:hypothetical protein